MTTKSGIYLCSIILLVAVITGCSTRKNTASTRFYHALTTKYNVYFNGNEAYKEGIKAMQDQNKDNYMDIIPLYPIGNPKTIGAGGTEFERTIEKSQKAIRQHSIKRKPSRKPGRNYTAEYKQWLSRKEFNPYLHNAWMLLGKAQFHKGDFPDAMATFSYIARLYEGQPQITAEANLWLARSYTEMEWYYEAEDLLTKVNNDSLPDQLIPAYRATLANVHLEQKRYKEAIPLLENTVKKEKIKKQRARECYLLGQIYQNLGETSNAYQAYSKVIKQAPPYELELSARIRQTEVMPAGDSKKIISKLRSMARSEKNTDYLDQIYYAIGNTYLAQQDTAKAITEYKLGVEKSTRNRVEKGILQLTLGNIYWQQARYAEAQAAYADAIGLIDKQHPSFAVVNKRSEVLDELVTHSTAIQLQDSLQHLASLSEPERIAIIEKIIEEVIRKEKEAQAEEERKLREETQTGSRESLGEGVIDGRGGLPTMPVTPTAEKSWYFYNPQAVAQGKRDFERNWGRRKLEDNWRRRNKTTVPLDDFAEVDYSEPTDTLANDAATVPADSIPAVDDNKTIGYYMSQIPLTDEAMKESNNILSEALFQLALVYKDKLEDFALAQRTFNRLISQFPAFEQADEAYYHLYLMLLRQNKQTEADHYKQQLALHHPDSKYTTMLTDPNYLHNAIYGKQLEDSLYVLTYKAFGQGNYQQVATNNEVSASKYPLGKHRPKFMFLNAMTQLETGQQKEFLSTLRELVTAYPENEITELAAYILQGIREGRQPVGTGNAFGSIWSRRKIDFEADTLATEREMPDFDPERNAPYLFIFAYEKGTVNENLLLYEVARYNFSNFIVKNFDLSFVYHEGVGMLQVSSFANYDEARQYYRQIYTDQRMAGELAGLRPVIISQTNYEIMTEYYSFDDYDIFYQETIANEPDK